MNCFFLSISKKGFTAILGGFAILAIATTSVGATADGPDFFRVNGIAEGETLSVYAEPNSESDKVGALPAGTNGLRNLGCEGGLTFAQWETATAAEREAGRKTRWCRIQYREVEGWVPGWLIGEGKEE